MIKRIVKLTILPGKESQFKSIFINSRSKILSFDGCSHVELLQDLDQSNIFFTYSKWTDVDKLNSYRESDIFQNVWSKVKAIFADKPEAWSLN